MIDLLSLVSPDTSQLEFLDKLEREIEAKEIAGRRLYVLLAKHFPTISLLELVPSWHSYTLVLPPGLDIGFHKLPNFKTISLIYHPIEKHLNVLIYDDPDFLEIRRLLQHILNENKHDD